MCCASVSCHPDSRPVFFRSKNVLYPIIAGNPCLIRPLQAASYYYFQPILFAKISFFARKSIYIRNLCVIYILLPFLIPDFSLFPSGYSVSQGLFPCHFCPPPAICPKIKKESPSSSKQLLPEILLYLHFLRTSPTDIPQILIPFYPSDKHVYARRWVNRTSCPYGHIPPVRPRT